MLHQPFLDSKSVNLLVDVSHVGEELLVLIIGHACNIREHAH